MQEYNASMTNTCSELVFLLYGIIFSAGMMHLQLMYRYEMKIYNHKQVFYGIRY